MIRHSRPVLLVILALSSFAPARAQVPAPGEDRVLFMADEDPVMRKAVARAHGELDAFFELAANPPADKHAFALKVGLPLGGDRKEYVWIIDFQKLPDGRYVGEINNDVELTDQFKLGDRYTFTRSQIIDWNYVDRREKKMYGNYTLCALLSAQPGEDANRLIQAYKLDCAL